MKSGIDDIDDPGLREKLRELKQEQEEEIQKKIDLGEIIDFSKNINGNGKKTRSKQKQQQPFSNNPPIISEKEKERIIILNEIIKLRQENPDLTFEQWSNILIEKRQKLKDKVNEYFPEISLELDFVLSIKTILNIEDNTLPFMGIVFAVPSSMKTQVIELLRKWIYSYFTDKFTAKSFVSHSATVAKEKLKEVDLLPRIKDKILLTPELSPLFTGKEEDIKEQFGIITKVLDGKGLLTESGVHGQRGYEGDHMFVWIGAAVEIPYNVYKFLSTIGFKIYFLRLPRTNVTTDDLVEQLLAEKPFNEKIKEIKKVLVDCLKWFEICPVSIGLQNVAKIGWNKINDDRNAIKIIAELAQLLAHLRGYVYVSKTDDFMPIENNEQQRCQHQPKEFIHGLPTIENPSRAVQQLYNLARGHALYYGRNYITIEDISLVLKVVLSTGSIERILILDLLIANKGALTTSQITTAMRISNNTAKRTMTEFKGLELVTMDRVGDNSNSEYKIILNPKFNWFLTNEFKKLRDGFKPTDNKEYAKTKNKKDNFANEKKEQVCCNQNTPCVPDEDDNSNKKILLSTTTSTESLAIGKKQQLQPQVQEQKEENDSHKGENGDSKNDTEVANNIQSNSSTLPSYAFTALMPSYSNNKKLFNNPLISESDLSIGYSDPEVINNIDRVHPNSDRWFCNNCTLKDDKWGMMRHVCKHNKRKKDKKEKEI